MSENKIGVALVHEICPICGKPMNEQILMNTVLSKKYAKEIENVHGKAIGYSKTACEDCSKYKDEAVMCIAIDEAKSEPNNPYFTDDEWRQINSDGTCQNRRKGNVFKEPDSSICYNKAFNKRATDRYSFATKQWTKNENPICWYGGLFEYKNNVLTGRYFNTCYLQQHDIINGWTPKPTRSIDCVEIETAPDNWIMAVDTNDIDLIYLSLDYDIKWEECPCLKGICLEDVTSELEQQAYNEIKNNKQ